MGRTRTILGDVSEGSTRTGRGVGDISRPLRPRPIGAFIPGSRGDATSGTRRARGIETCIPKGAGPTPRPTGSGATIIPGLSHRGATGIPGPSGATIIPVTGNRTGEFFGDRSTSTRCNSTPPQVVRGTTAVGDHSEFSGALSLRRVPAVLTISRLSGAQAMFSTGHRDGSSFIPRGSRCSGSSRVEVANFSSRISRIPIVSRRLTRRRLHHEHRRGIGGFHLFAPRRFRNSSGDHTGGVGFSSCEGDDRHARALRDLFGLGAGDGLHISFAIIFNTLLLLVAILGGATCLPSFLGSSFGYCLATVVVCTTIVVAGVNALLHKLGLGGKVGFCFPMAITTIVTTMGANILLTGPSLVCSKNALFPSTTIFTIFVTRLNEERAIREIVDGFRFLANEKSGSAIRSVMGRMSTQVVSGGVLRNRPCLGCDIGASFPADFLRVSFTYRPTSGATGILSPMFVYFGLTVFIVVNLVGGG